MFRYKLRTLMIVLALGPVVMAWGWRKVEGYRRHQELRRLGLGMHNYHSAHLNQPPPVVWKKAESGRLTFSRQRTP